MTNHALPVFFIDPDKALVSAQDRVFPDNPVPPGVSEPWSCQLSGNTQGDPPLENTGKISPAE